MPAHLRVVGNAGFEPATDSRGISPALSPSELIADIKQGEAGKGSRKQIHPQNIHKLQLIRALLWDGTLSAHHALIYIKKLRRLVNLPFLQ